MDDYPVRTPEQLAQVLKGRRKALRMNQQSAADSVGLLPKTISIMENSAGRSSIASLYKLLSALNLELVLRPKEARSSRVAEPEW